MESLDFSSVEGVDRSAMENEDIKEIQWVLWRNEDIIQANNSALMVISSKITEIEQAYITHNANIMSLIFLQKQRIDSLERV
jgi:hypothetical protein